MGATYGFIKRNTVRNFEDMIFGISYAVRFHNMAPREANFDRPSENNIQMVVASLEGQDILMQFKLSRNNLSIIGYDPNVPTRAKAVVDSVYPSVDNVIKNGKTIGERMDAQRLKDIMSRTMAGVSVESLSRLANELKRRRKRR